MLTPLRARLKDMVSLSKNITESRAVAFAMLSEDRQAVEHRLQWTWGRFAPIVAVVVVAGLAKLGLNVSDVMARGKSKRPTPLKQTVVPHLAKGET